MDFGRLPSVDHVDFSLPPDPVRNKIILNSKSSSEPFRLFAGCPAWGDKEWLGVVYPKNAKSSEMLALYSRQFNCIELNTTYYRIPTPAVVTNWEKSTSRDFKFCPKIPQAISHTSALIGTRDLLFAFCAVLEPLGEKLGTFFLQLPPWFGTDRIAALKQFVSEFPKPLKLAVEFRHESWFADPKMWEDILHFLEDQETGTVITDTAGRRDVLHMRLTTNEIFIRFTANDLHTTDIPRMEAWAQRLKQWKDEGAGTIYFFVHSPSHVKMPHLVHEAVKIFNRVLGTSLTPCRFIEEQQTLF